jgi:hypothetical protein
MNPTILLIAGYIPKIRFSWNGSLTFCKCNHLRETNSKRFRESFKVFCYSHSTNIHKKVRFHFENSTVRFLLRHCIEAIIIYILEENRSMIVFRTLQKKYLLKSYEWTMYTFANIWLMEFRWFHFNRHWIPLLKLFSISGE